MMSKTIKATTIPIIPPNESPLWSILPLWVELVEFCGEVMLTGYGEKMVPSSPMIDPGCGC